MGERATEGRIYGNLGNVCYKLGNAQDALEYHNQCLSIFKAVGDRAGEGMAYYNLGIVASATSKKPSSTTAKTW